MLTNFSVMCCAQFFSDCTIREYFICDVFKLLHIVLMPLPITIGLSQ